MYKNIFHFLIYKIKKYDIIYNYQGDNVMKRKIKNLAIFSSITILGLGNSIKIENKLPNRKYTKIYEKIDRHYIKIK